MHARSWPIALTFGALGLGACGPSIPAPWDGFGFPTDNLRLVAGADPERFELFYNAPGTSKDATHERPDEAGNLKLAVRGAQWRDAAVAKGYTVVCEDLLHVGGKHDHFAAVLDKGGSLLVINASFNAPTGSADEDGFVVASADSRKMALNSSLLGKCNRR